MVIFHLNIIKEHDDIYVLYFIPRKTKLLNIPFAVLSNKGYILRMANIPLLAVELNYAKNL